MIDLHAALSQHFGLTSFRPGQEPAIRHVLGGHDTLAVMPTGWGKSLIYQLAALMLPGTALIISPLVALMKDQVDSLVRRGVAAMFINSSLDAAEQAKRLRAVAEGQCRIVLVAPERLHNRAFVSALRRVPVSLLAVDEAHCISQWGHDFRPDYLHIADVRRFLDMPAPDSPLQRAPMLALTATATPRVQDDIVRLLGMSSAQRVVMGFDRPNLTFEVFSMLDSASKQRFIRDFLSADDLGAGIIYTGTRGDAEEVARFIREEVRIDARYYHGSLDPDTRSEVQDAFMAGDLPVVVATNAFGMGIDRPDVRFVLHHSMPSTLEAYYQEAGRAGRDGLPARAVLLFSPKDTALHKFFVENDSPSALELRAIHDCLTQLPEISLATIHDETGVQEIKVRLALEHLEVAGAIRRGSDGARGQLDIETAALSDDALNAIIAQVAQRRQGKLEQLDRMVGYAETNTCRRRVILDHFGDRSASDAPLCCDNCLAQAEAADAAHTSQATQGAPTTEGRLAALTQAQRAALIVLDTLATLPWEIGKGKLVQVLKGSQAKDMAMEGYARNRNFGKFAALHGSEIESLIVQLVDSGHLKQVGSTRPTLKLTARGEAALKNRSVIDVRLRTLHPAAAERVKAQKVAGSTVAYTEQLLMQGLLPEQIAAQRMLSPGTIYTHMAQLITAGRAKIDQVVPAEVQQQVRAVIQSVGSVEYLAPIKAGLPETIDYGVIRCVTEAWKLEHGGHAATPQVVSAMDHG
jgi:ATP-dependent DNA helicase RecQ